MRSCETTLPGTTRSLIIIPISTEEIFRACVRKNLKRKARYYNCNITFPPITVQRRLLIMSGAPAMTWNTICWHSRQCRDDNPVCTHVPESISITCCTDTINIYVFTWDLFLQLYLWFLCLEYFYRANTAMFYVSRRSVYRADWYLLSNIFTDKYIMYSYVKWGIYLRNRCSRVINYIC